MVKYVQSESEQIVGMDAIPTDERAGAGESLRQNPARAGVDPVLLPSFGVVCFLSLFLSSTVCDCLCVLGRGCVFV